MSAFRGDGLQAKKIITATRSSDCINCEDGIGEGDQIMYGAGGWSHVHCMPRWKYSYLHKGLEKMRDKGSS